MTDEIVVLWARRITGAVIIAAGIRHATLEPEICGCGETDVSGPWEARVNHPPSEPAIR